MYIGSKSMLSELFKYKGLLIKIKKCKIYFCFPFESTIVQKLRFLNKI